MGGKTRRRRFFLAVTVAILCVLFLKDGLRSAGAQPEGKIKVPDVCYKCHGSMRDKLSDKYKHPLFSQGKCLSCHDVHVSSHKGLLHGEINAVCLDCHEGVRNSLKSGRVHGAVRSGACTDCHSAHSGNVRRLLVKEEKDLCWDCHGDLKDQLGRKYVHAPFKEGECSKCHAPHASTSEALLAGTPSSLCQTCHAPRCKVGAASITSVTKDMDCTSCHGGHSSQGKGFFGPYGHSAFLQGKCGECHNPVEANRPITTKKSGKELCFMCHEKNPARYKEKDVHEGKGGNACTLCHSAHASRKKNLTAKESAVCLSCHEGTEKRTVAMERTLKVVRCEPVKKRECFECHAPLHSAMPLYLKDAVEILCAKCHEAQHKISHPMGEKAPDPRTGKPTTCITCHSMHAAQADFMLTHDRKRQLCIQCHKR